MRKFKFFGLVLAMSGIVLAGCGPKTPSSTSPVDPSSPGGTTSNTLEKALQADYSNMTVECVMSYEYGGEITKEYFKELVYKDYTIIMPDSAEDTTYLFYHDYQDENYMYFPDNGNGEAWLKNGLGDSHVGLEYTYFSWEYSLKYLKAEDATYSQGAYIISNPKVIETLNSTMFYFAWFNNVEYVMLFVNEGHITQITALCSIENDNEAVVIKMSEFGSTVFTDEKLPPAPNANNVRTYYDYTGTTPVVDKYIDSLTVKAEGTPAHDAEADIILDIEKTADVSVSYLPEDANKKDITWHVSDESVLKIDSNFTSGWRTLKALKEGSVEVYATAEGKDGATVTSNKLKVRVNPLPEQNKEGAVYDFTFINIANDNVIATNAVSNDAPFTITSNKAVLRDGSLSNGSFEADRLALLLDPLATDFSKPSGSEVVFNFDDQQVSSISLYYGLFYDGHKAYADKLSSAKIMTSNDGETWEEIDVLDQIKENASAYNKKLMEYSFAPASIVKIKLESSMVGNSYMLALDYVAFMADENCHMHTTKPEVVPVESIEISANTTEIKVGGSVLFGAVVNPSDATDKAVVWHSDNEEVLTVDSTGKVTGVKEGEAKVYATTSDGLIKSNEVTVTVLPAPHMTESYLGLFIAEVFANSDYHEFRINVTDVDHAVVTVEGETYNFTLDDYNADDRYYTLKGDNDTYLKLSYSEYSNSLSVFGEFGGFTLGNTHTNTGEEFVHFVAASEITISCSSTTIVVGDRIYVSAKVTPEDAFYHDLDRTVSDPEVADFDETTDQLIAKKPGEVTITYTNAEGVSNSITITVEDVKPVTGITVEAPKTSIEVDEEMVVTASITPSDYNEGEFEWSSSDKNIASVRVNSNTGVVTVTGKAVGSCDIICTDKKSGISGSLTIEVVGASEKIPADMQGTWTASGIDNYATFTFTFSADGKLSWQDDTFSYDETLSLVSKEGNTYVFEHNDYSFTFTFDGTTLTLDSYVEGCYYSGAGGIVCTR